MSRRWSGLLIGVLVLSAGVAVWLLIFRQPPDTLQVSEIDNSEPVVSTEPNAMLDAQSADDVETEPKAEVSEPNNQNEPAEPMRAQTPIMDRAARERLTLSRGRGLGPGAAEIAARNAELQPSEIALLNKTSPELVDELASSPLQMSIYHSSDNRLDGLLASFARAHKGVDVLLSRPDAAASLLENYRAYSESIVDPDTPADVRGNPFQFATLEVLLGANVVLDQFESQGQLPALIDSVLLSREHQAQYNAAQPEPVYGESMLPNSATVVGRALVRLDDTNFLS